MELINEIVASIVNEFHAPLTDVEMEMLVKCLYYREKEDVENDTELAIFSDARLFALDFYEIMPLELRKLKSEYGKLLLMAREV